MPVRLACGFGGTSLLRLAIDLRVRVWFNPQLESRFFMIPGVLALLLLLVTANLAAMAVVREKELGTLEQLNVTPLRRWELIVGKLLPYGVIAMIDVLLVTAVAVFWFEVPLRGSFTLLLAMSLLYVVCTLALGLFISTISETQQQAMMTATFFFLTPMIYLSGFIFPIENMPQVIQYATYLIPAALLPGHRPGHLPEGDRAGPALAAGGCAGRVGRCGPGAAVAGAASASGTAVASERQRASTRTEARRSGVRERVSGVEGRSPSVWRRSV